MQGNSYSFGDGLSKAESSYWHITFQEWQGKDRFALPHKAAHRISELNLFLYLRISGVSLCGRVFVGFTLTTDPFRVGSCLIASDLIASLENPTERKKK